jgi:Uncharacterized protein conserved in bacteria
MTQSRTPTDVDALADSYLAEYVALDPLAATYWGIPGHDAELPDLSPDGLAEVSALRRRTLDALDTATPVDRTDRITVAALREELAVAEELRAAGHDEANLNNIDCAIQNLRMSFDLVPSSSADDWSVVATRLSRVPEALTGYATSLRHAAEAGHVAAQRQVRACIEQCAEDSDFFTRFVAGADGVPESLRADLDRGAAAAGAAYRELGAFLADELLAQAPERDAVGRDDTPSIRARSSAPGSTWTRPTRGGRPSWPGSLRRCRPPPSGSSRAPRSTRRSSSWTPSRRASCRAPTRCGPGCRRRPTPRWPRWPARTSTSRPRSAPSSAASRRRRPAASTTPARATTW